ncbi:MAG: pyruvate dehydrogenase complex dihydrolipoamide acetyltransferase [Spirochaetota bacterium]
MAEKVLMTALSPTMEEGTIVSWNKKEGDSVSSGDLLCEVETDKATMDYESTQEGTLLKIIRGEGSASKVGDTIAILGEEGEDIAALVAEAEHVPAESPAVEKEETGAPAGAPQAPGAGAAPQTGATASPPRTDATAPASGAAVKASPLAKKIAAERRIDIGQVSGSGPGGRVVKSDVESFTPGAAAGGPSTGGFAAAAAMQPGSNVTVPVTGKRAVIARRLAESKFTAPHYYLKNSVKMDAAITARKQLNAELPEKVGFNAFLIKFAAEALKRHPEANASWQGDHILQFGSIDIGLAVDLGNGLITPVVRNCGNKGIVAVDRELKELISKAGAGKLQPEEYTGATFTISNLGSFGIEEFTAIINPPGSAILAVGEIAKAVVVNDDDEIDVAQIMKMTLSCDHRVIDGAAGGRFLSELKRIVENPVRVLF